MLSLSHLYPPGQSLQKAVKLFESQGKPKASDYNPSVCMLLNPTTFLFCGKLTTESTFPDAMLTMMWAKSVWLDTCKMALTYGFKGGNRSIVVEHNVQLACECKTNFAFANYVCNQHFCLSTHADCILSRNEDQMETKVCISTRSSNMPAIRSGSVTRKMKVFVFPNSIAQSWKWYVPSCSQLYVII